MLLFAKVTASSPSDAMPLARHLASREATVEPATLRPDTPDHLAALTGMEPGKALSVREVACLLAGRTMEGKRIEGRRYQEGGVSGFDFILTPDKSVSVAWAFGSPSEQEALLAAHKAAGLVAMEEVAERIGQIRRGAGGRDGMVPGDITWAATIHATSKPMLEGGRVTHGDPDLHTHYSVPNVAVAKSGEVGALHSIQLSGHVKRIGMSYQDALRDRLRQLGADVTAHAITGAAVLQDIPDRVREHFSRRGREAKTIGGGRRLTGDLARDAELARDGRPDKAAWRSEAHGLGWTPASALPHPMVARAKEVWRAMEGLAPGTLAERFKLAREVPMHGLEQGLALDSTHDSPDR
jgi:conjugative relaxase-like TrwC/TraI family protein